MPRCLLIVCYDFPSIEAAGVIRTYHLAKRLSHFGWQPIILKAQSGVGHEGNIETSDGALPYPKITVPGWRFPGASQIDDLSAAKCVTEVPQGDRRLKSFGRLATRLAIPDGKIGWLYSAVKRGLETARLYPVQMLFSVSPRPTAHLVAYKLARRLNFPWVVDFALPWSDAYWLTHRPRFIQWLDQRLESLVVRSAQHVTVAYTDLARSLCARYGHACKEKISVVPTGFDEDLFARESCPSSSKFTVLYPGNHFCEEGRYGECFLKAIDEWIDLEPSLQEKVEFRFIGKRDDQLLRQRAAMTYSKVVRVESLIAHRACIDAILSSHLCVVNTFGNRIPAKIYECMRAGKWILALTDSDSDLDHLMRQYRKGISIPARDIAAIRSVLQSAFQRSRSELCGPIKSDLSIEAYSSAHGAQKLAAIFEKLVTVS